MKTIRSLVLWWLAASILLVSAVQAQSNTSSATPSPFKAEELDALLAPIALYPDALLAQILMAATYPLEVVQAARWAKANPKLDGDAAVKKVESESWDVSVKSLVAFPNVLEMMNEKLEWTQKLGDALLAQQKDVAAAIQRLRRQAKDAGNLQSNQQQVVRSEAQTIIIEPAQPQVVYVPAYNPTVVYGTWPYPAYPPYYYHGVAAWYPGTALVSGLAWGVGFAAAGAMFGGWNWGHGDVDINVNRATNIDRNYNRNNINAGGKWQHNPQHRGNVGYRDQGSRERYSGSRGEYRGRDGERAGGRDGLGAGDREGNRDGMGNGDRGGDRGGNRDGAGGGGHRDGLPSHGQFDRPSQSGGNRANAFDGVGGGNRDLDRGRASTSQMQHGGAGGNHSFGAGGGGGGRSFSGGGGGGGSRAGGGGRGGRR